MYVRSFQTYPPHFLIFKYVKIVLSKGGGGGQAGAFFALAEEAGFFLSSRLFFVQ